MEDDNNTTARQQEELIVSFTPEDEILFVENEDNNASQSASGSPSHVSAPATSRLSLFEASFTIKNKQSDKAVLFRIRTTSPANYRVKPAYGRIEPSGEQLVRVFMLSESKKNDKFLIMFTQVDPSVDSESDFNGVFDAACNDFVQKKKIPCSFPPSLGLLAATGLSASGAAISPIAPSLSSTMLAEKAGDAGVGRSPSIAKSSTSALVTVEALQADLKEANRKIERLSKELKLASSGNSKIPKEWSDLFKAQYGAPPVLILLVAIFAFLVGLLF